MNDFRTSVCETNPSWTHARKAQIVDLESGRVIVTYPIDLPAQNGPNAEWEMMERAWRYAVEDGITRSESRGKFAVRIVPIDWVAAVGAEEVGPGQGNHD